MTDNNTKPFICPEEGCDMTFTNQDHLDWHKKKHDMMLNLGLANSKNGETADQTPTPTRFIRNCEEVGLFQDLQNNPFDEIFKKATESVKAGHTLEVPHASSDDTLHTPQIYPQVEQADRVPTKFENGDEFSLVISETVVQGDSEDEEEDEEAAREDNSESVGAGGKRPSASVINEMKKKIKEAMVCKKGVITPVPLHRLRQMKDADRMREMNRAAQVRCRQRKARQWSEMESELHRLRQENARLQRSNTALGRQVAELQATVIANAVQQAKTQLNGINFQQSTQQSSANSPNITSNVTTVTVPQANVPHSPVPVLPSPMSPTTPSTVTPKAAISLPSSISSQLTQIAPGVNPVVLLVAPGSTTPLPVVHIQGGQFQGGVAATGTVVSENAKSTSCERLQAIPARGRPVLRKIVPKKIVPKLRISRAATPKDR